MQRPHELDETRAAADSAPRAGVPEPIGPGASIAGYRVERLAARGGFATVFQARAEATGERVALKVLNRELMTSSLLVERFRREAAALDLVAHPAIVKVLEVGELPLLQPYLVMEWIEGHTLAKELKARGTFSLDELVSLMEALCDALGAAHGAGLIHRDLKPSNIMVIPAGEWFQLKLVDFGIAKIVDDGLAATQQNLTVTGTRIGTPSYMAPEQLLGQPVDARTDIYALGVITFLLLTGQLPFKAPTPLELEELHLYGTAPRVSERASVPPGIDAVVQRCLEKRRENRYPSVTHYLDELRAARRGARVLAAGQVPNDGAFDVPTQVHALGVHVAVFFEGNDEELDDEALVAIEDALADAEETLTGANMDVALSSGNALVAIRAMERVGPASAKEREEAVALALTWMERFARDFGAVDPRLHATVALHVAPVAVRRDGDRQRYPEGELLRLSGWTAGIPHGAVVATESAVEGLEGHFVMTPLDRSPGRLRITRGQEKEGSKT